MKIVNLILIIFLIMLNKHCIFHTESIYNVNSFEEFKTKKISDRFDCHSNNLEYFLFQELQTKDKLECKILTYGEEYQFQFVKTDQYHSSFIVPWNELNHYGLMTISFLAWVGLIPNYQERKVNISVKVFSKKGKLWEKDYYDYYEIWSSILFLPWLPIQSLYYKENIPSQTLLSILEHMVVDFKARSILEK
ncbi:MAG: hypothetical protein KBF93_13860 [Leptospiraceae bacterium]|nr:hypothetical protein [Leptospiraceae bacterium]